LFCHCPTWSNPYQPYPWRISRWNPDTKSASPGKRSARRAHSIRMSLLSLLSTTRRTMGKGRLEISGRIETRYSGLWRGIPLRSLRLCVRPKGSMRVSNMKKRISSRIKVCPRTSKGFCFVVRAERAGK